MTRRQDRPEPSPRGFPVRRPWDAEVLLAGLRPADVAGDGAEDLSDLVLFDMNTEYDAVNLLAHLDQARDAGRRRSPEFDAFLAAWSADEWNHYVGYRRLRSLLTGRDPDALHDEVAGRTVDFAPIASLLEDEFHVCLVIAYDELFTIRSCMQDYPLYDARDRPELSRWIRLVARDEGFHCRNALEVILRRHADRLDEVPGFLDHLVARDLEGHAYGSTFLLDHDATRFDEPMLRGLAARIVTSLDRRRGRADA